MIRFVASVQLVGGCLGMYFAIKQYHSITLGWVLAVLFFLSSVFLGFCGLLSKKKCWEKLLAFLVFMQIVSFQIGLVEYEVYQPLGGGIYFHAPASVGFFGSVWSTFVVGISDTGADFKIQLNVVALILLLLMRYDDGALKLSSESETLSADA